MPEINVITTIAAHYTCTLDNKGVREMSAANVGNFDRSARIIIGIVLIAMVFVGPKTAWGWIGLIPLLTGLIRWCPAYRLFGMSTCKK